MAEAMAWGVTSTGFAAKPLSQIVDDISAALLANISPSLNLSAASALGQIVGIVSAEAAAAWDALQATYSAYDPNQSTGDQLASLSLLTGTVRRAATASVAQDCIVNVDPGTYAAGTLLASVAGDATKTFANATDVVNAGGAPANVVVDFVATTDGPVSAVAGTLSVIASAVVGWNSVTNPTDAIVGLPLETDPQLRLRRTAELATTGAATADAIRSDIATYLGQQVGGDVVSVSVNANDTDVTDVNGVPPHSFETIALGAVGGSTNDALLAARILASKTAGDGTYGTTTVVVNDSQGNPHSIRFTRPTLKRVYIAITVKTTSAFPLDGAAQIAAAMAAWAQANLLVGVHVVIERIKAIALGVVGVDDVTACTIGFAPAPAGTVNLAVNVREIAQISSGDVAVTVS